MSGGSFNYLCWAQPLDLLNKRQDISDMVKALSDAGHIDAAAETETILLVLNHFEALMQARIDRLSPVWKAIEWKRSGDWGKDAVDEAFREYRAQIEPKAKQGIKND